MQLDKEGSGSLMRLTRLTRTLGDVDRSSGVTWDYGIAHSGHSLITSLRCVSL